MLKYSWNEYRAVPPHHSLAPGSSLSLDGPYCLPCVTRAHLLLPLHHLRHHARLDKPGKVLSRSRELVLPGHYACSSTIFSLVKLPHPHVHTDAHVYTYTCEKKLASSRDRDLPSEEIDSTIISAALFVDSFSTTMKMGKNRAKRRFRFSNRRYPPPSPRCTHTYLQNHICCVALVSVN